MNTTSELSTDLAVLDAPAPNRRTIANRLNALKSTGPKTPGGKAIARCNAVKHGLTGQGVVLPRSLAEDASERTAAWKAVIRPRDRVEVEMVELAATSMSRLRRCWKEEALARAHAVDRADRAWDVDRNAEVETLAAKIDEAPGIVVAQLRRTAHGAAWLLERWQQFVFRLEAGKDWDEATRTAALDLLGVPPLFRDEFSPVDLHGCSDPAALRQHRINVIVGEMEILADNLQEHLAPLDEDRRELRRADVLTDDDPAVVRLMRYERLLTSRTTRLIDRFRPRLDAEPPANAHANSRFSSNLIRDENGFSLADNKYERASDSYDKTNPMDFSDRSDSTREDQDRSPSTRPGRPKYYGLFDHLDDPAARGPELADVFATPNAESPREHGHHALVPRTKGTSAGFEARRTQETPASPARPASNSAPDPHSPSPMLVAMLAEHRKKLKQILEE